MKLGDIANAFGLLILRVGFGLYMFIGHGLGKAQKLYEGKQVLPMNPLEPYVEVSMQTNDILVTAAEAGCAILIVLGLLTRLATIPLIVAMAVAAFLVHVPAEHGWTKIEPAVVYLTAFVVILFVGPGKFSLDTLLVNALFKKKDTAEESKGEA